MIPGVPTPASPGVAHGTCSHLVFVNGADSKVAHAPLAERSLAVGPVGAAVIEALGRADASFARGGKPPVLLPWPSAPGGRVVVSALGTLVEDVDDVRPPRRSAWTRAPCRPS